MADSDASTPPRDLVEAWSSSAQAVLDLVRTLSKDELSLETDLPGWTVRDILAHLAHLECELAGDEPVLADEDQVPADARENAFRSYTERGVAARREEMPAVLIEQLDDAVHRLRATLDSDRPADPPASFPRPGATWAALLHDRVIDYWMHEQDIRQAVGRSGGWDSPGADVTIGSFWQALPFIVGKKVRPPAGTTVAWSVTDSSGTRSVTIEMGDDGRARPVDVPADEADVALKMPVEDFVLACGGRRDPAQLAIEVRGDDDLGSAVLAAMPVTP
jgi:uncharacterized protein (TIGR03083 family)